MGCDIHSALEVRFGGKWHAVNRFEDRDGCGWAEPVHEPIRERDYRVFALLADVRNCDGVVPISKPKGIPSNLSPDVAAWVGEEMLDGHSHSWLSLAELREHEDRLPAGCEVLRYTIPCMKHVRHTTYPFPETDHDVRVVFFFDN